MRETSWPQLKEEFVKLAKGSLVRSQVLDGLFPGFVGAKQSLQAFLSSTGKSWDRLQTEVEGKGVLEKTPDGGTWRQEQT